MNNLPVVLGSIDKEVPLIVTDSLHLDAILGTDALGMFQTAIDLEARAMLLKDSGEMLPITRRRDIWSLFTSMLWELKNLFDETSKRPGSAYLLEFCIDTGTHEPIKQQPY
ncbi:hypothetical protein PPTG_21145 [Phytophthora nicotianae INRA-310]|uniref:Uncharacterized protein n=1 Tax=Phytophthora nicotianae (strain INRA-310) TaxID=761204 RepID=W2RB97_PHYN3|nr:hypothetical protein PPTG_21145 [Phytophthora nicotianae INRA-310]ETN21785.1 hypothetical protein PPTG_21145 [Phytophthora nicotianae INRA-310]